jgi:HAD superfamily hydrolase (TIGR01490 family)
MPGTMAPPAGADTMRLTIFDLDHTLLAGDSDYGWGQFMVRHGLVDAEAYARENAAFFAAYQAGNLDQAAYLAFSLEPLTRYSMEELDAWHRTFMVESVEPLMTARGRLLVQERLRAGDLVAIVTSTNSFITKPIARAYGVEHLIATDPEVKNRRYTGRVAGTPAFREGKVTRLHSWLRERGRRLEDFDQSWFYSDSTNDLPLLETVTHPVAVDPDAALRQIAERRHWSIISLRDQVQPPIGR